VRVLRAVVVPLPSPGGSFRPLRFRVVVTLPATLAESPGVAFRLDRVTRPDCGSVSPPSSASRASVLRDESRVLRLCSGGGGGVVAMDIELVRLLRLLVILCGDEDAAAAMAAASVGVEFVISFNGNLSRTSEGLGMAILSHWKTATQYKTPG